jgi:SAM-dependent methyltransferase
MGFEINSTRFLFYAKRLGVDFSKTATIGRQGLHVTRKQLKRSFVDSGIKIDEAVLKSMLDALPTYAERFLKALGAAEVDSFDFSSYEGATITHDMNLPAPEHFKEKYSVVIDGGSLEHVFNYPTAIKNCLEFVRPGGHFIAINPGNNYLGHGFYQFSPELYFRILVPENGFEIQRVVLAESVKDAQWWAVRDPAVIRCRSTLVNDQPTLIYVLAKKIASVIPLRTTPQQSDYVSAWMSPSEAGKVLPPPTAPWSLESSMRIAAKNLLPPILRRLLSPPFKPEFFEKIDLQGKL